VNLFLLICTVIIVELKSLYLLLILYLYSMLIDHVTYMCTTVLCFVEYQVYESKNKLSYSNIKCLFTRETVL